MKHLSGLQEDLLLSFVEASGCLKQNLHFEQKVQSPYWEQSPHLAPPLNLEQYEHLNSNCHLNLLTPWEGFEPPLPLPREGRVGSALWPKDLHAGWSPLGTRDLVPSCFHVPEATEG